MAGPEVETFLSWLAAERGVAVSTHRQALSALLFLYSKVLGQDVPWMQSIGRPQRKPRLPVVLSADEVARVLTFLVGEHRLLAQLLYGTGLRITEGLQLRVKDIDFERRTLIVRAGKGGKDRAVMLPAAIVAPLREQLARSRVLWAADREAGHAGVMRSSASTRAPALRGPGSGLSRRLPMRRTHARAWCVATTCMTRPSSALSSALLRSRVSPG